MISFGSLIIHKQLIEENRYKRIMQGGEKEEKTTRSRQDAVFVLRGDRGPAGGWSMMMMMLMVVMLTL